LLGVKAKEKTLMAIIRVVLPIIILWLEKKETSGTNNRKRISQRIGTERKSSCINPLEYLKNSSIRGLEWEPEVNFAKSDDHCARFRKSETQKAVRKIVLIQIDTWANLSLST
jgi:hypothetical protein